jgi:hypothetical protein
MLKIRLKVVAGFIVLSPLIVSAQSSDDFFWDPDFEIAVAKSAAPAHVADNASIWVLKKSGYEKIHDGSNGFNCLVMRQWSAGFDDDFFTWEDLRAPICFDKYSSTTVMREQMYRAELGLQGQTADEIRDSVYAAFAEGRLKIPTKVSFAYMFSAYQNLTPRAKSWRPHMMVYAPYQKNEELGGNTPGGPHAFVLENPGTFRAITTIPVDSSEHLEPTVKKKK